jgi:phenylacetate-coenzyme A ligase PaaK-like adenylate-forming protein
MGLYSRFVRSVMYPAWLRRDNQPGALQWLGKFEQSQYMGRNQLRALQRTRLKQLLEHAQSHSPYYRRLFRGMGWQARTFRDFSDLRNIPPVTKSDLLKRSEEMVADNIPRTLMHHAASGGSTGQHTPFYRDNASLSPKWAAEWRFHKWSGWNLGEPMGLLWPARQDLNPQPNWKSRLRNATFTRQIVLAAGALTEQNMDGFARDVLRRRVRYLKGFTNAMYLFCHFCKGRYRFSGIHSVICTGEPVLSGHRDLIEKVLGAPVFDYYGAREVGPIAAECEMHEGLHLNDDNLYVEIEKESVGAEDGAGSLLITDLNNYAMPLIRYRIGDRGQLLEGTCPCGRSLSRMGRLVGRTTDFLLSTKGEMVHGAAIIHYVLALGYDIGQVQFVQRVPGRVTVRVAHANGDDQRGWEHLERTLRSLLGIEIGIDREAVESIPPERSGKYRVTVCEIELPALSGRNLVEPR